VHVSAQAHVAGNLLCDGARIEGSVVRSVIGPGVVVANEAEVRDSIIMNDALVGPGVRVDRAIVDKEANLGEGAQVGHGVDNTPNGLLPEVLNTGLTLVGKRAFVPPNSVLGRNVTVAAGATAEDFPARDVPSGADVPAASIGRAPND
jgi:glucose-1-phosphate adenylyltransferase